VNVLLTSAGRRVELLRILQSDLQHLGGGTVVVADASVDAPCMQIADRGVQVPRLDDTDFGSALLGAVVEHGIGLVVPTIDTELKVLAELRPQLEDRGAQVLLSGPETISIAGDKLETSRFLTAGGFPHPQQWSADEALVVASQLPFPVFVKPRRGSASVGVVLVNSEEHLRAVLRPDHLVQKVAPGVEYTVDAWVDSAGAVRSCVARRRISVRGGEVEKGVTERHGAVLDLAADVVVGLPDAFGPLTVQAFADGDDVRIIEINARYGGGYPLAWEAGAKTTRWAIQFGHGRTPEPAELAWADGVKMLRYDQSVFVGRP